MDNETRQLIERMERQIAVAHTRIDQRPLWPQVSTAQRATVLQIIGGQALAVIGLNGIKVALTAPATITDYDLTTLPTCVDGIGYGTNLFTGQVELIGNCPPSWHRWDLIAGQVVEALSSISMLITASSPARYRTVWVPSKMVG